MKNQILITIAATGKVIYGVYDRSMIGYHTSEGFFNIGDATPA